MKKPRIPTRHPRQEESRPNMPAGMYYTTAAEDGSYHRGDGRRRRRRDATCSILNPPSPAVPALKHNTRQLNLRIISHWAGQKFYPLCSPFCVPWGSRFSRHPPLLFFSPLAGRIFLCSQDLLEQVRTRITYHKPTHTTSPISYYTRYERLQVGDFIPNPPHPPPRIT